MNFSILLLALAGLGAVAGNAAPLSVRVVPMGSLPPPLLGFLQEGLAQELGAEVSLTENLPLPDFRHEGLRQYRGEPFLQALADARTSEAGVILGVTNVDLFVPGLNFVFGLADPRHRVAVISLARLYPEFYGQPRNPQLFKERALKEAIHEIGHVLGLGHCPDPACIMHFSNTN
ncbi:MAG: archaemetzincin family Zn-dependent metalloprotease [Deltaproteobacteria bacterium]